MTSEIKVSNTFYINLLLVCLGSLQFGYHMGALNSAGPYITCKYLDYSSIDDICIPMDSQQFAQVTSVFSLGGLIGSFFAGKLADLKGRKYASILNALGFVIGSFILIISNNVHSFLLGRWILGVSSGSSIVITSLMITEIAPIHMRDSLGTFNQAFINIGILLVQFLSIRYAKAIIWKSLFKISLVFSIFQVILLTLLLKESTKWLFETNDLIKAKEVLRSLRSSEITEFELLKDFKNITTDNEDLENNTDGSRFVIGWKEYLTNSIYKKSALFVAIILVGQQFCGINSIILYSTQLIGDLTSDAQAALPSQVNFGISVVNTVFTFISPKTISIVGKKNSLSLSALCMGITSLLITLCLTTKHLYLLITFVVAFIISFALGVGPIPFAIISDLTPSEARTVSQSYGTVINWIGTFFVSYSFPILADIFGLASVFSLFAIFSIVFSIFIYFKLPTDKVHRAESEALLE